MNTGTQPEMNSTINQCIQHCWDSHRSCLETASYCLQMGGAFANPAFINLLMDCATICATNANFMIRNSTYHLQVCGFCAIVCTACADACSTAGHNAILFGDLNNPDSEIAKRISKVASTQIRADLGLNTGVRYQGI